MSIAMAQDIKRLKDELEAVKKRLEDIENRPKPGRKPKGDTLNAVR